MANKYIIAIYYLTPTKSYEEEKQEERTEGTETEGGKGRGEAEKKEAV